MPRTKTEKKKQLAISLPPGQIEILEKVATLRGGVSISQLIVGELNWAQLSKEAREGARADLLEVQDEYQPHILGTNERAYVRGVK